MQSRDTNGEINLMRKEENLHEVLHAMHEWKLLKNVITPFRVFGTGQFFEPKTSNLHW